jgi:hypothetical protein
MAQAVSRRLSPRRPGFDPMPIPVAARSRTLVYGRSLTRIVGSNPTGGMDVCVVFDVRTVAWNVK